MTNTQTSSGGQFGDDTRLPPPPGTRSPQDPHPPVRDGDHGQQSQDRAGPRGVARWWAALLDGGHVWGSVNVSPTRHGVTQDRLVVFPPGIDTEGRRLLRLWRAWPTWGALLGLLSMIFLDALLSPGIALAVAAIGYFGSGVVLFGRVADVRARVRTLTVVRIAGYPDDRAVELFTEMKRCVGALRYADDQCERGTWSPLAHEAVGGRYTTGWAS